MTSVIDDLARRYRLRAAEVRARADAVADGKMRKKFLSDADTWERMAAYEERTRPHRHLWADVPDAGVRCPA